MQRRFCKYFKTGNCKFGNSCKYLHLNPDENACDAQIAGSVRDFVNKLPDSLANTIKKDLVGIRNIQINPAFTAYGLGPHAANNLIEGRDLSPEELRLQYMEAVTSNTLDQYNQNIDLRQRDMQYCISEVTNNARIAARYQQQGVNTSGIRPFIKKTIDESMRDLQNSQSGPSAFGSSGLNQSSANAINPFAKSNPFGPSNNAGSFGSAGYSNNNSGAFSQFANSNSSFGKLSFGSVGAFGSNEPVLGSARFGSAGFGSAGNTSSFGSNAAKPSAPSGAFGSSGFGQPPVVSSSASGAFGASGFGSSGFGQSSISSNQPVSAFGSSNATSSAGSGFGSTGFGNTGFGSLSGTPSASGDVGSTGFGSSVFGGSAPASIETQSNTASNSFAQSTSSAFGGSTAPISSGFGSGFNNNNSFGAPSISTFVTGMAQPTITSAFGQSPGFGTSGKNTSSVSGFGNFHAATHTDSMKPASTTCMKSISVDALGGLDPEVREAFLAPTFEFGRIPEVAPPPEIC